MIFLGDIAHPFNTPPDFSALFAHIPSQPAVINLEGPISSGTQLLSERRLFNHASIVQSLKDIDTRIAVLSNNHICDLQDGINLTRSHLLKEGIQCIGAGRDFAEASAPARIVIDGHDIFLVAFGWKTIQCRPATPRREGVQPLETERVLSQIKTLRRVHPQSSIIPVFHWNYELELYPQPAHRRLAFAAIDAGADAVVAHHPHCVGGFEFHRGKLIAYSLGNWWMPQGVFFNGKLSFPEYTFRQVALEWHPDRNHTLHWFRYNPADHSVSFENSEALDPADMLGAHAAYAGMSESQYLSWFRANRIKRKALPIYKDPNAHLTNAMRDNYVRLRHPAILMMKRLFGAL